jgi:hypothetical protein
LHRSHWPAPVRRRIRCRHCYVPVRAISQEGPRGVEAHGDRQPPAARVSGRAGAQAIADGEAGSRRPGLAAGLAHSCELARHNCEEQGFPAMQSISTGIGRHDYQKVRALFAGSVLKKISN